MRILAITSSYPLGPGDSTAPFVASIVESVAELGHDVDVLVPEHRGWRRAPVEGRVRYHTYRYSPRRSWTPWGFSEALGRKRRDQEAALRARPGRARLGGSTSPEAARGRERSISCTCTGSSRTGRSARSPCGGTASRSSSACTARTSPCPSARPPSRTLAGWSFERSAAVVAPSADLLEPRAGTRRPRPTRAHPVRRRRRRASLRRRTRRAAPPASRRRTRRRRGRGHRPPPSRQGIRPPGRRTRARRRGAAALRLVLVGDGDERERLARQAQELGVADTVRPGRHREPGRDPGIPGSRRRRGRAVRQVRRLRRRPPQRRARGDGRRTAARGDERRRPTRSSSGPASTASLSPEKDPAALADAHPRARARPATCARGSVPRAGARSARSEAGRPSGVATSSCTSTVTKT